MELLPTYLPIIFICIILITLYFLYKASSSKTLLLASLGWILIQSTVSLTGFYTTTEKLPPRIFLFLLFPALLYILLLFLTPKGKQWMDTINVKWLTYLHTLRIPVELTLFGLYVHHFIPELMTFEGRNLDILSGISAPIVGFLVFSKHIINNKTLLIWNFICLGLLLNVVTIAILSAPFPFQQLAFGQPNIAIFYFPFVLLPGFVVPAVLLAHLISIRRLLN